MQSISQSSHPESRSPTLGGLSMLVGFILLGGTIIAFAILLLVMVLQKIPYEEAKLYVQQLVRAPQTIPNGWFKSMALQAINHLGTFLLPSLAYWYWIEHRTWAQFNARSINQVAGVGLVVLIVIAFMPFDGLIIEWNQNLHLPDTLKPLEQWIRNQEKGLEGITKYLTTFNSPGQLAIALLVIAVIPAIGEETLFRGILQRNLTYWTGNVHVGIWVGAALFSAIHVQFLGFFPRMLLGAMFGYLYVWSGNLWVPMLAHFVNNGFTVLMVYLYQRKLTTMDVESNEAVPIVGALIAGVITAGLLYYFRQSNGERNGGPTATLL